MNNQNNNQTIADNQIVQGELGLFNTISGKKTKVVYTNFFTGKVCEFKRGFFINFPWRVRPVKVSLSATKIDTVERTAHTAPPTGTVGTYSAGPSITYDIDYFIKVVDPVKYVEAVESKNAAEIRKNIGSMLDQTIRDYIIKRDYDTLLAMREINVYEELKKDRTGGRPSIAQALKDEYGIEICDIECKLQPSRELLAQADKTAVAEQAVKTAEAEQRRMNIEATEEAKRAKLDADKEAYRVKTVMESGLTSDQVTEIMKNEALTNGSNPNTTIFAGNVGAGNVMVAPGWGGNQPQQSANIPVQSVAPVTQPVSDVVPEEAVDKLKQVRLLPPDISYGNVIWSGLPTVAYDFLVREGYQPPNTNQNSTNYHI